jgi:hypothetical protein
MAEGPLRHAPSLLSRLGVGEAEMNAFVDTGCDHIICLRMGPFLQTGLLAHSAADGTLSAAAKSSDHVRHFSGEFQ